MLIGRINSAPTGGSNYLGYTRHTSSCLGVAFINPVESHSLSMLIGRINSAPTSSSNYLGYTRHTSSCLGVAFINPAESHSLSMLIGRINSAPTGGSNYSGYTPVFSMQERGVNQTSEPHRSYSSAFSTLTRTTSPGFTLVAPFK